MARQASTITTQRLVFELKAARQDECDHEFDKRLAIAKELSVGRCIVQIHGAGAVVPRPGGRCTHMLPSGHQVA